MPAFTIPLYEFNTCHTPAGSAQGGQFCSKTHDAFIPPPARKPLPFTRRVAPKDRRWSNALFLKGEELHEWQRYLKRSREINNPLMEDEALLKREMAAGRQPDDALRARIAEGREKFTVVTDHMAALEEGAARRAIREIATELGFPHGKVRVINDPNPRTFEVGGRSWREGGHFNPMTGNIQINLHNTKGSDLVQLVAHEIAHAKFEVWRSAMDRESEALKDWKPEGLDALTTRNKTPFAANGEVRPEFRAEFRRRFPAHIAAEDTWGHAYKAGGGDVWERMQKDDGFTEYSKAYWTQAAQPGSYYRYKSHTGRELSGTALSRAVDETLAEVAAWRVNRRMEPYFYKPQPTGGVRVISRAGVLPSPSAPWRKFSARITRLYKSLQQKSNRGELPFGYGV